MSRSEEEAPCLPPAGPPPAWPDRFAGQNAWFAFEFYQRSVSVEVRSGVIILLASGGRPKLGGVDVKTSLPFPFDVEGAKRLRDQLSAAIEEASK